LTRFPPSDISSSVHEVRPIQSGGLSCQPSLLAQNLWDHYAYTGDKEYLETRSYPVTRELCEFWEDYLKTLPDGILVSPDGFSPEHGPHEDGVSFDQQLVFG